MSDRFDAEEGFLAELVQSEDERMVALAERLRLDPRPLAAAFSEALAVLGELDESQTRTMWLALDRIQPARRRLFVPLLVAPALSHNAKDALAFHMLEVLSDNEEAVAELLALLPEVDDPADLMHAVDALHLCTISRGAEVLKSILADPTQHDALRGRVAEVLLYGPPECDVWLIRGLDDPSAEVRFWCAFTLGQRGCERAKRRLRLLRLFDHRPVPGFHSVSHEARNALKAIRQRRRWRRMERAGPPPGGGPRHRGAP